MNPSQEAEALRLLKQAQMRLYAMVEDGRRDCLSTLNAIEGFLESLKEEKPTQVEMDIQTMAKFICTYRKMSDPYDEFVAYQSAVIAARIYYTEEHGDKD